MKKGRLIYYILWILLCCWTVGCIIASILLELFLRFPSQVSDQPLGSEGILRGHPVTHHCVQESLPLARVETQNLKKDQFSIVLFVSTYISNTYKNTHWQWKTWQRGAKKCLTAPGSGHLPVLFRLIFPNHKKKTNSPTDLWQSGAAICLPRCFLPPWPAGGAAVCLCRSSGPSCWACESWLQRGNRWQFNRHEEMLCREPGELLRSNLYLSLYKHGPAAHRLLILVFLQCWTNEGTSLWQ